MDTDSNFKLETEDEIGNFTATVGRQQHKAGRNPVRAIHNFEVVDDNSVGNSGNNVGNSSININAGGEKANNNSNSSNSNSISATSASGRKLGSPAPVSRKSSPRSSPRTSPLSHRGSSPHNRSSSPHHFRSSLRTSPSASSQWTAHSVRNKSAFNKVKPSTTKRNSMTKSFAVVTANNTQNQQISQQGQPVQGLSQQHQDQSGHINNNQKQHVPIVLASSGGASNQRSARSPVTLSGIPRNMMPNSPKLNPNSHGISSASSTRQDPTSRDIEFLMGGALDDDGFGSDNELIYYGGVGKNQTANVNQNCRPSSSNSHNKNSNGRNILNNTNIGNHYHMSSGRPKSCTTPQARTTSPIVSRSYGRDYNFDVNSDIHKLRQMASYSSASTSPVHIFAHPDISSLDRGRMMNTNSHKQNHSFIRQRSNSLDSLRKNQKQNQNISLNANSQQIAQASLTREQIKQQKRDELNKQLQQYQQSHEMQMKEQKMAQRQVAGEHVSDQKKEQEDSSVYSQQQYIASGPPGMNMSLEEVFRLERLLNTYKTQLLRQEVLGTPNSNHSGHSTVQTGDIRTTPKHHFCSRASAGSRCSSRGAQSAGSLDYELMYENECYLSHRSNGGQAQNQPKFENDYGVFDYVDDVVPNSDGSFHEANNSSNYMQAMIDKHNGANAPSIKMFRSCDRNASGYISPSSSVGTASSYIGMGVENDLHSVNSGSIDVEGLTAQLNRNVPNYSCSPGGINFISWATHRQSVAEDTVYSNVHYQQHQIDNVVRNSLNTTKNIDSISSPRSAFSRAKPIPIGNPNFMTARPIRIVNAAQNNK